MEYFTAPGQGYVILTAGGTITSPDGTFSLTLDAGQTYFRATTDKIIVSDASATLCPVAKWPGMQPISVNILGEGTVSGDVPASYIVCSFLESTGDQIIDTGLTLDSTSVIRSTSRTPATAAGQWEALYDTDYYMGAYYVNTQFCFIIYDENVNNICYSTYTTDTVYTIEQAYDSITINGEKLTYSDLGSGIVYDPTKPLCLFNRSGGSNPGKVRLMSLSVTTGGKTVGDYVPVLNEAGVPCMYDKVTQKPYLNTGGTPLIAGMSTAQALNLAKLPAGGGSLVVSLPDTIVSAAGDVLNEEVAAAIETATDNGWTITVQSYVADDLSDVGGGDYIRANFLESTGTQWVDTKLKGDTTHKYVLNYQLTNPPLQNPLWGMRNQADYSMGPIFCFTWTGGSYNLTVYTRNFASAEAMAGFIGTNNTNRYILIVDHSNAICTLSGVQLSNYSKPADFVTTYNMYLYSNNVAGTPSTAVPARVFSYYSIGTDAPTQNFIPAITPGGTPCMYDGVTKQPFYNSGTGSFIVGLTTSQALNLANLPEKTASLTISLPASIVSGSTITDAQVASAIETARSKGWTITVRTYTE